MKAPSSRKFFKAIFYLILTKASIPVITCFINTYVKKKIIESRKFNNLHEEKIFLPIGFLEISHIG